MTSQPSRRRFLSISAALAVLPVSAYAEAPLVQWRGTALGAGTTMRLAGVDQSNAQETILAVQSEINRLESIFSIYRQTSALSRLNRTGRLKNPPPELLELVSLSGVLHRATDGAFDPTIQPLWMLYAQKAAEGKTPQPAEIQQVRELTGWTGLHYSSDAIRFAHDGMALTFNGIAQGYIADKIADLLRVRGMTQILIDMGEIFALGRKPNGTPWQAGIATPDNEILKQLPLENRAIATSAPLGTLIEANHRVGHILDPRSGVPSKSWKLVSVSADRAALADGLSTAFCLLPRATIDQVLAKHPNAALEILV